MIYTVGPQQAVPPRDVFQDHPRALWIQTADVKNALELRFVIELLGLTGMLL